MTKSNPHCKRFAELTAKQFGMTYVKATKKYPRSCNPDEVYLQDGCSTKRAHCLHCARAEAMLQEEGVDEE